MLEITSRICCWLRVGSIAYISLSALLIKSAGGCDGFLSPTTPDLSTEWYLGKEVAVHWDVNDLEYVNLRLNHWGYEYIATLASNYTNSGSYLWTIGENDNVTAEKIADMNNFVLILQDPDGDPPTSCGWVDSQLQSPGFVLTTSLTSSTTSTTTSSSTSTTSSIATTTTASSTTSAAAATSTSAAPAAGSLSTAAQAGIGVGVGVAGLLFFGAIAIFYLKRRKNKKRQLALGGRGGSDAGSGVPLQPTGPGYRDEQLVDVEPELESEQKSRIALAELNAVAATQELESREVAYELDSGSDVRGGDGKPRQTR